MQPPNPPGRRLAALALLVAGGCGGSGERPNVVLISIDSLRADHLGCYGYARDTSPGVDRIASEGARFEQHIASSTWTLPSHAALFTSLPDSLHGCTDTDRVLAPEAVTLAERFRAAGYETAGFFSGPYLHPAFGFGQGFDRYEDCTSYAALTAGGPPASWANRPDLNEAAHRDVTGPRVLEAVRRWFGARSRKPFFLFVHLWDVHFDYNPPPPFDKKYDADYRGKISGRGFLSDPRIKPGMNPRDLEHLIALYDGEIAWTDTIVAGLREMLEKGGDLDRTVLAITADHGTEFFEHGSKAHRQTLYDEVIHVPFVLRFPPRVPARTSIAVQTRSIDVGPTLLELAGLPPPADVMGRSLLARIAAPSIPDPAATSTRDRAAPPAPDRIAPSAVGAAAPEEDRAVSELCTDGRNVRSVRTTAWKLVDDMARDTHYYFDLQGDRGEGVKRGDFGGDLGRAAEAGYLEEVRAIRSFGQSHAVPAEHATGRSAIPSAVVEDLKRLGYVGGPEGGTASGSRH